MSLLPTNQDAERHGHAWAAVQRRRPHRGGDRRPPASLATFPALNVRTARARNRNRVRRQRTPTSPSSPRLTRVAGSRCRHALSCPARSDPALATAAASEPDKFYLLRDDGSLTAFSPPNDSHDRKLSLTHPRRSHRPSPRPSQPIQFSKPSRLSKPNLRTFATTAQTPSPT